MGRSHQIIDSYLRPTALNETQQNDLTKLYYGDNASSRTHRFSRILYKKAKDVQHVIWVPNNTEHRAHALSFSLSNLKTAWSWESKQTVVLQQSKKSQLYSILSLTALGVIQLYSF